MRNASRASARPAFDTPKKSSAASGVTEIDTIQPIMSPEKSVSVNIELAQTREELIARYEYLADQYEAVLDERDELRRQRKNLELEVVTISKQQKRLEHLLAMVREEKGKNRPQ